MAIGLPRDTGYGSLRFSFGQYNTKEDADYVLEVLPAWW
jgi:cysteine desulfurase